MTSVELFHVEPVPVLVVQTTPEALEAREEALAVAHLVPTVKDAQTRQTAIDAMATIKRLLTDAERSRKALKEPFLEGGRLIDWEKTAYVAPLQTAYSFLDDRVKDFETAERERAAEETRRQQAELEALKQSLPAPATAQEAKEQAEMIAEREAVFAPAPLTTAQGQSVSEGWDYEIISLDKLYHAYGARLVDLTEKRREVLSLINSPECPTETVQGQVRPKVPGLRIKRDLVQRVRPAKAPPTIDVHSTTEVGA